MNIPKILKKPQVQIFLAAIVFVVAVILFTKNSNREYFNGADVKLVMYYADWCGHCKTTKPEFKKLGKSQKVNGKTVAIEMVNADSNPQDVEKAGVEGFPTIHIVHKNGRRTEFQGNRTASNFKKFMKDHIKPKHV